MWDAPGRAPTRALKLWAVLGMCIVARGCTARPAVAAWPCVPVDFAAVGSLPTWAADCSGFVVLVVVVPWDLLPRLAARVVGIVLDAALPPALAVAVPAFLDVEAPAELVADLPLPDCAAVVPVFELPAFVVEPLAVIVPVLAFVPAAAAVPLADLVVPDVIFFSVPELPPALVVGGAVPELPPAVVVGGVVPLPVVVGGVLVPPDFFAPEPSMICCCPLLMFTVAGPLKIWLIVVDTWLMPVLTPVRALVRLPLAPPPAKPCMPRPMAPS